MSNKRVSELTELAAGNLKANDLFMVTDTATNVLESKKVKASSIKNYVLDGGIITGSITTAVLANTASYVNPLTVGLIPSASYSITSSYSITGLWSNSSGTASHIASSNISGSVPSSSYSATSSYVLYGYDNGTVENSKTSSYITNALSASFLKYTPGVNNGTASYALSASVVVSPTASYLSYTGISNGTASYALSITPEITASYLRLVSGRENGSASFSVTSSYSLTTSTASYLSYTGISNGTASYAITADSSKLCNTASYLYYYPGLDNGIAYNSIFSQLANSSSWTGYSISSSYSNTSSYNISSSHSITSSYALKSATVSDATIYRTFGPYSSTDDVSTHTTTQAWTQTYVVNTDTGAAKATIIQAIGDIKVPLTSTEVGMNVYLYLDWIEPSNTWSVILDQSLVSNYVTLSMTGAFTLSGYNKQGFSLGGVYNLSGSYYKFRVMTDGGTLIDTRAVKFIITTKADSITKV